MITKAQHFAAAALADLRAMLASKSAPHHEGPAFNGSGNCLANIERDYARRNRGHWFDKDAMRFFGTRYASGFLDIAPARVTLFVTSEKPPHGPRRASIRAYFWDSAQVDTLGPFCEVSAKVAADAVGLMFDTLAAPAPIGSTLTMGDDGKVRL